MLQRLLMYIKLLIVITIIIPFHINAQEYIDKGKTRYTFAQTTIGYDMEYTSLTGYSYQRDLNGNLNKINIGNNIDPVISITGLHFWGHAEFFTGFSLGNIHLGEKNSPYTYKRSGATGAKIFPWAIKKKTLRPYMGFAISSFAYQQNEGTKYQRVDFPILAGLTYSFKHGLLEIGCNYHYNNQYTYYISKTEKTNLIIPALSFTIDYKYFFDLSISSARMESSGALKEQFEWLKKKKKLSSISIAAGPAYSFFVGESSYNKNQAPYLDDYKISNIYPDLGIGYYNYHIDATINLSWRFFNSTLAAYNTKQTVKRNSIAIEAYKFLGDYHGFVPFIGGIISQEHFNVNESINNNHTLSSSFNFLSPGIIAGWDIRPTRSDWWGVRTNIRYFPLLQLNVNNSGEIIDMQQIELNFLQLILYPNRIQAYLRK